MLRFCLVFVFFWVMEGLARLDHFRCKRVVYSDVLWLLIPVTGGLQRHWVPELSATASLAQEHPGVLEAGRDVADM